MTIDDLGRRSAATLRRSGSTIAAPDFDRMRARLRRRRTWRRVTVLTVASGLVAAVVVGVADRGHSRGVTVNIVTRPSPTSTTKERSVVTPVSTRPSPPPSSTTATAAAPLPKDWPSTLFAVDTSGTLVVVNSATGATMHTVGAAAGVFSFGPDRREAYLFDNRGPTCPGGFHGQVSVVPISGGTPRPWIPPDSGAVDTVPEFRPDGALVAYQRGCLLSSMVDTVIAGVGSNHSVHVVHGGAAPIDWSPDGRFLIAEQIDGSGISLVLYTVDATGAVTATRKLSDTRSSSIGCNYNGALFLASGQLATIETGCMTLASPTSGGLVPAPQPSPDRLLVLDPATGSTTTTLFTLTAAGERLGGLGIDRTRTLLLYSVLSQNNLGPVYALPASGDRPIPVAGGKPFSAVSW